MCLHRTSNKKLKQFSYYYPSNLLNPIQKEVDDVEMKDFYYVFLHNRERIYKVS